MTDQTIPDVTDDDRRRAREWAEGIEANPKSWSLLTRTAARVILNAVPTPPTLPTLADMTDEERAACLRMQCDTAPNRSVRGFIADIYPGGCRVIERDTWEWRSCSDDLVTPRPDLPRMAWPGDQEAEDANTVKIGDLIQSAADPRIDALPAGSILLDLFGEKVEKISDETPRWTGPGCFPYAEEGTAYGPWKVIYIGQETDPAPAPTLPDGWRLADHKGYGRGIVTNPTPNRDGHVYFVIPDDDPMGYEWVFCTPDDLTYLAQ